MTDPNPDLIRREFDSDGLRETLNRFSKTIEEVVNFGSQVFTWLTSKGTAERYPIVFVMLLRHHLELLDALSILIRHSSIEPSRVILRAALEVFFSFKYMFAADTPRRAGSFLIWHVQKVLRQYDNLTPDELEKHPNWKRDRDELAAEMNFKEHEQIVSECKRLSLGGKRLPSWYSFFGGPVSLRDLAQQIGYLQWYDAKYRSWSGPVHGTDIFSDRLASDGRGGTVIFQIRFPKSAERIVADSLMVSIECFSAVVTSLVSEKNQVLDDWMKQMVQVGLIVSSNEFIKVEVRSPASGT